MARIDKIDVDASDFSEEEIKCMLDKERAYRNMPIPDMQEILEDTRRQLALQLIKLDDSFARETLKLIKEFHPELFTGSY